MFNNLLKNINNEENEGLYDEAFNSYLNISVLIWGSIVANIPHYLIYIPLLILLSGTFFAVLGSYFDSKSPFFEYSINVSRKTQLLIQKAKKIVIKNIKNQYSLI